MQLVPPLASMLETMKTHRPLFNSTSRFGGVRTTRFGEDRVDESKAEEAEKFAEQFIIMRGA